MRGDGRDGVAMATHRIWHGNSKMWFQLVRPFRRVAWPLERMLEISRATEGFSATLSTRTAGIRRLTYVKVHCHTQQ
jgi:hypothetical protein